MTVHGARRTLRVLLFTLLAVVAVRFLGGCYLDGEVRYVPEERVDHCVNAYRQVLECDYYYEWVPGYYDTYHVYIHGWYRLRQGWAYPPRGYVSPPPHRWYRPAFRDHRR